MTKKKVFWVLFLTFIVLVIPFLDIYDFNTKGEPREAIVSYNMLESGNWILPRNSVGEIAYKPPFFHWCIAAVSYVWGEVNEFTSRLPSAVAFISLCLLTFSFFAKRRNMFTALLTVVICFTCNEFHRQGFNCRVDMMLTFFTVTAMYRLYRWYERGMKGVPWVAVLMMSLGVLTKGPIGTLLPCLVTGVFLLMRRVNFFKALLWMCAIGILSLIIPAFWYYAAYQQAGQEFLDLAMEENVGRMTNTMSYQVHTNPWYANILYLLVGFLPWVILLVISLFTLPYRTWREKMKQKDKPENSVWKRINTWLKEGDPIIVYSHAAVVVIFIFYCIPDCKRSVYLMPMYPFLAFFIARYIYWLVDHRNKSIKIYGGFISILGMMLITILVVNQFIHIPDSFFHGRRAQNSIDMVHQLHSIWNVWSWVQIAIPCLLCAYWWKWLRGEKSSYHRHVLDIILMTVALYIPIDAVVKPAALNAQSVKHIAMEVEQKVPRGEGDLYEYIEDGERAKGDPVHFFELNFYMHDRIGLFTSKPEKGYLLIGANDAELRLKDFEQEGYRFTEVYNSGKKTVMKQQLKMYQFEHL